jgi:predicted alpha/beta superfamily hydrolase
MKPTYIISELVVFLLLNTSRLNAQATQAQLKPVCLDNTEQFSITSKYVTGENYIIQVSLPIGYAPSKKSYPVLYVLDGDKSFGMTKEIADWLMWSKEIKDIIVVGISYGQGMDAWWSKRARDYTHCLDTIMAKGEFLNAGGAENFLGFVNNELFPIINKNYKTNQDSTAIMGLSFGGMLSTYTLFTHPDMFREYIIIAPSLVWNNHSILKMETEYFNKHKELNKSVYMAYGSLDSKDWIIDSTDELIKMVKTRNYQGLKFETRVFEGETHISVFSTALTHGLKSIFER